MKKCPKNSKIAKYSNKCKTKVKVLIFLMYKTNFILGKYFHGHRSWKIMHFGFKSIS